MNLKKLEARLKQVTNPKKAEILQRFFKTGKGDYGEGDIFLGVMVPESRKIAQEFESLSLNDINVLLKSKIHEKRLIGLLILVKKFREARIVENKNDMGKIYDFYLKSASQGFVNNWDLVDLTAPNIVGNFLLDKKNNRSILYKLVCSDSLWERRISIIATFEFIRNNDFDDCLRISKILLQDKHDLIHKAVGWMLRELGKRDRFVLEKFLKKHYKQMPRTMLRYSIERFEESKRQKYLKGKV